MKIYYIVFLLIIIILVTITHFLRVIEHFQCQLTCNDQTRPIIVSNTPPIIPTVVFYTDPNYSGSSYGVKVGDHGSTPSGIGSIYVPSGHNIEVELKNSSGQNWTLRNSLPNMNDPVASFFKGSCNFRVYTDK
jgi:hypothetical protein